MSSASSCRRRPSGIDGISLLLILLTTFMGIIAIVSSYAAIDHRQKEYYILLLLLQTFMIGPVCWMTFRTAGCTPTNRSVPFCRASQGIW